MSMIQSRSIPPLSTRRSVRLLASVVCFFSSAALQASEWESRQIHDRFYCEGSSAGDVDADGHIDIVAGPLCFFGPDFQQSAEIEPAREYNVATYSDHFISQLFDADGDLDLDLLVIGFPGKPARLYVNPGVDRVRDSARWQMYEVTGAVDNESAAIVDLIAGGLPEVVCGRDGQYGYYQAGDGPTDRWHWNPVTRPGACAGRFAHGLGVGDLNRDGRLDLVDRHHYWLQPESNSGVSSVDGFVAWSQTRWAPADYRGGAQILVRDVDGDGDSDIVTSLHAHGYGLSWFEQTDANPFKAHTILGQSSTDNRFGIVFSQMHAVAMADINGDGVDDIVTGKRWMAHNGKDPGGLQSPELYWFECVRDWNGRKGVEFIPRRIDDASGVGVDILVADINRDGRQDVVSSNKHGLAVHYQPEEPCRVIPQPWIRTEGRDQDRYANGFDPLEAADGMLTDDGFVVDLVASEPELTQPIAMCFDARGRLWVNEAHTYPRKASPGQGRDRIVVLEDSDANGSFETKRTFMEGVNLASGIEVGFGGVWVGAAPELLFIPDADHDCVPDGPPRVLLDG